MFDKRVLMLAVLAGEIILSSGGETYRVEDTMDRILKCRPVKAADTFVTPTGIFASVDDGEDGVYTVVRRIKKRTYHLDKVARVNHLSRQFVTGQLSLEQSFEALRHIKDLPDHPLRERILFSGVACFCFTAMFGGSAWACLVSMGIGLVLYAVISFFARKNISNVIINIVGGGVISLLALSVLAFFPVLTGNLDKIIIGSIMPLVPGIGLTNAVRDIIEGDYVSGTSRILDAILVSVAIATGVGFVMVAWINVVGGIG